VAAAVHVEAGVCVAHPADVHRCLAGAPHARARPRPAGAAPLCTASRGRGPRLAPPPLPRPRLGPLGPPKTSRLRRLRRRPAPPRRGSPRPRTRRPRPGRRKPRAPRTSRSANLVPPNLVQGVEAFKIYQEVQLLAPIPRVNNVVDFGPAIGYLTVQAEASTESRPLEGFTPRCGAGGAPARARVCVCVL
jgi:hypothetical protein